MFPRVENKKHSAGCLCGQETEYAIRFTPAENFSRINNYSLYIKIRRAIKNHVATLPGDRMMYQEHFFIENGGAFNYEFIPSAFDGGLIEGGTPECQSPTELLVYQRAQERLLCKAVADVNEEVSGQGTLSLIKNCKDAKGNIYGAQENYEVLIGSWFDLLLHRIVVLLSIPLMIALIILPLILIISLFTIGGISIFVFMIIFKILSLLTMPFRSIFYSLKDRIHNKNNYHKEKTLPYENTVWNEGPLPFENKDNEFFDFEDENLESYDELNEEMDDPIDDYEIDDFQRKLMSAIGKIEYYITTPIASIFCMPILFLYRFTAFRRVKKGLLPFLITRPIISGAGSYNRDNTLSISEKATAIKHTHRVTIMPKDRAIFEFGHFLKDLQFGLIDLLLFRPAKFSSLFRKKQRLQLGLSDSNRCDIAEYLKAGITSLVISMIEDNFLKEIPHIKSKIKSLKLINNDASLKTAVPLRDKTKKSALEIQRYYCKEAEKYVKSCEEISIEYFEIIKLWKQTLDALENDPGLLVGRIDWITKRYLIETAGKDESFEVKKKIDIAYHELATGYHDILKDKGISPQMIDDETIENAIHEPSSPEKVQMRSKMIKNIYYQGEKATVSWGSIHIGSFLNRKVIKFPRE